MEYRNLGRSGLLISELCLGCMTFNRENDQEAQRIIDRFFDAGGNFLDTADVYSYGASEEVVGRALKRRQRTDVILATKVRFALGDKPNDNGLSRKHIMDAIDSSLRRLSTDYIDLYQAHCWDSHTPLEETLSTLDDLVRAGKVRYIGLSNFAAWQIAKSLSISDSRGWARFISVQPQYSLIVRDIEREIFPLCREEGLGVIPWSPLGGGFLSGKYGRDERPLAEYRLADVDESWEDGWQKRATDRNWRILDAVGEVAEARGKSCAQVALAWLLAQPGVAAPILGVRTLEQLEENLGCIGWRLSADELQRLAEVSAIEEGHPYRLIRTANEPVEHGL